eukprot:g890.t1
MSHRPETAFVLIRYLFFTVLTTMMQNYYIAAFLLLVILVSEASADTSDTVPSLSLLNHCNYYLVTLGHFQGRRKIQQFRARSYPFNTNPTYTPFLTPYPRVTPNLGATPNFDGYQNNDGYQNFNRYPSFDRYQSNDGYQNADRYPNFDRYQSNNGYQIFDRYPNFGFNPFPYPIPSAPSPSVPQPAPQPLPQGSYPVPKGDNQEWDIVATGVLKATPDVVWNAIKDPRRALSIAYRQFAYDVTKSGRQIDITLNSGSQMIYTVEQTQDSARYHHFTLFGHSQKIFNIPPSFVNIRRSQLFILVKESTVGASEIVIGLQIQSNPAKAKTQIQFFLQGFLTQLVDHFQMKFGVGDCTNSGGHREVMGICNNPNFPLQGSAETPLKRLDVYDPSYIDNNFTPAYSSISPRLISNIVCAQGSDEDDGGNKLNIADIFVFFGQFIDHDVGITAVGTFTEGEQPLFSFGHAKFKERFDIVVPKNDPDFTGLYRKELLPFDRSIYVREDGRAVSPRMHPNSITSYLDLSQIYGSDRVRAKALRAFVGGKLRTSGTGRGFLPFNGAGPGGVNIHLENAPNSESIYYVSGDIRVLENPVLASLHALFLLEHNKVAEELATVFSSRGLTLTDEELFQFARDICVAEYQSIIFSEWIPVLLGTGEVSPNDYYYDPSLDASLDSFFSTASFRFGHSMVSGVLWKRELDGRIERMSLQDVFFKPQSVDQYSFSKFLLGALGHPAREMDEKVVDGLRSKLFTEDGKPSMDLVALNIQRGRDHGLPSYNRARMAFGLPPMRSFAEITDDVEVQRKLSTAYDNRVDLVDAFIGGLAEKRPHGRLFGDLFYTSLKDQFTRLRQDLFIT